MDSQNDDSGRASGEVPERLRLLEGLLDPVSTRRLEATGVARGWSCLEVGAGAGSLARWLSERVGPAGTVVATDIETRFLQGLEGPGLEVRRHDIATDPLERGAYDLVHCRTVLMWLAEPERALARMARAVRPGGWLVVEESDYGSILSADATDPEAARFTATGRKVIGFMRDAGLGDPYLGRRVRGLVEALNPVDFGQDGWTMVVRGGDPMARFDAAAIRMGAVPMIAAGQLAGEELEHVLRLSQDPAFTYPGLTLFGAWGRRPG